MAQILNRRDNKETNAIVLDYLQWGYDNDKRPITQREPIIIAIGTNRFKLLELIAKKNQVVNLQDTIYIGDGQRPVVERVKRRISYNDLTPTAKSELNNAIMSVILENESRFVSFYNTSGYFTLTKHMLHLLPGFTTQKLTAFLAERKKKDFKSYADIKTRVKSLQNPEKFILNRVLLELENPNERYRLFTFA